MNPCLAFGSEFQEEFTYKTQERTSIIQPIDARLLAEQVKNRTQPKRVESYETKEKLIQSLILDRMRTVTEKDYEDPHTVIARSKDLGDEELTKKFLEYHKNIYFNTTKKTPEPRRPTNQRTMGYSSPDDLYTGLSVYQDIHSRNGLKVFLKNAPLIAAFKRKRKIIEWMQRKNKNCM